MRYIVTRDTDPAETVCLWDDKALVELTNEGLWLWEGGGDFIKEFDYHEFNQMYKLTIQPGEKKLLDLVVAWIVEE